jgi:hypothetical protein
MTASNNTGRDVPSVAEIAALTARLRDLSHRGAAASDQERAAFLADKDALLARIPDADHDADDVVARAAARDADHDSARASADVAATVPDMPTWMREQAARTAAEVAAGTLSPTPPDDPVELAERIGKARAAHGPAATEEIVSRAEAVDRLADAGYDRASAETMVTDYLDETSRVVGVPVYRWGLDQYDIDDIIRRHSKAADLPGAIGDGESSAGVAGRGRLDVDDERRDQLARRHAADSSAQPAGRGCDHALERGDLP